MQLTNKDLIDLSRKGFIPGPEETEERFIQRVEACQTFQKQLIEESCDLPFSAQEQIPQKHLDEGLDRVEILYHIRPQWVPAFYSNKWLAPWHGASAWVIELEDQESPVTLIQLRRRFHNYKRNLGLYERHELLAHEYCHAGRMAYNEPVFEEFFSYEVSSHPFRKRWGPLVRSTKEVWIFLFTLFCTVLAPLVTIHFEFLQGIQPLISCTPLLLTLYAIKRLWRCHHQLKLCLNRLRKLLVNPEHSLACAYRMTDEEIHFFSTASEETAQQYIEKQREKELRWKLICLCFHLKKDL